MAWHSRVLGFLAATVAACAGLPHTSVATIVIDVVPGVLTSVAIVAGFSTVALWLLLMDRAVVARLRESGLRAAFVGCSWEAGRSMVWFVAVAFAILILDACGVWLPLHNRLVPAVLAGCFVWVCSNWVRLNRLMVRLLLHDGGTSPAK